MKSMISAWLIFFIIIIIIVSSYIWNINISKELMITAESYEKAIDEDSWRKADAIASHIHSIWDEKKTISSFAYDHSLLDNITMEIGKLKVYTSLNDYGKAKECLAVLRQYIKKISEDDKLSWGNIF